MDDAPGTPDAPDNRDAQLTRLGSGKYLLVSSYRKDGTLVPSPVWVVRDGDALGIWTVSDSWKVKRIRRRPDVLVGPCDVRGNPTGAQAPATAEICPPEVTARYRTLITRKYKVIGFLTLLGSRMRRGLDGTVGIRITLTP
ncbi:PPOX class F420-dependent oxidoreductase [Streptomyces alfalfae]|uniref:PPOX class F420-dependent enzyme n=1 Tax=Streptomyces alfalfae TaxID=1642299 RepID=A0ABM6GMH7_9ACTN|nr:PPOX class F420-dependent oxidoreductase [Streptomyces alfalfae]APY84893.1 PPOX class F420-dependent enzyme [Streptomyces alfalfae]QUI35290.1 PPOX class F420-dependent oxidoreductase [Streptomyces alfalfae]RXX35021.1 PPOX class F420-dependent oxidoreductase [Streptomyces alfalfae]RXX45771.1 PPOX class F420-dependent oxidoreductase [Streptomyces alfalfae]RXX47906.1 PPOX class F420-dependent oxidoreductase [Streptomyces alfalfae]